MKIIYKIIFFFIIGFIIGDLIKGDGFEVEIIPDHDIFDNYSEMRCKDTDILRKISNITTGYKNYLLKETDYKKIQQILSDNGIDFQKHRDLNLNFDSNLDKKKRIEIIKQIQQIFRDHISKNQLNRDNNYNPNLSKILSKLEKEKISTKGRQHINKLKKEKNISDDVLNYKCGIHDMIQSDYPRSIYNDIKGYAQVSEIKPQYISELNYSFSGDPEYAINSNKCSIGVDMVGQCITRSFCNQKLKKEKRLLVGDPNEPDFNNIIKTTLHDDGNYTIYDTNLIKTFVEQNMTMEIIQVDNNGALVNENTPVDNINQTQYIKLVNYYDDQDKNEICGKPAFEAIAEMQMLNDRDKLNIVSFVMDKLGIEKYKGDDLIYNKFCSKCLNNQNAFTYDLDNPCSIKINNDKNKNNITIDSVCNISSNKCSSYNTNNCNSQGDCTLYNNKLCIPKNWCNSEWKNNIKNNTIKNNFDINKCSNPSPSPPPSSPPPSPKPTPSSPSPKSKIETEIIILIHIFEMINDIIKKFKKSTTNFIHTATKYITSIEAGHFFHSYNMQTFGHLIQYLGSTHHGMVISQKFSKMYKDIVIMTAHMCGLKNYTQKVSKDIFIMFHNILYYMHMLPENISIEMLSLFKPIFTHWDGFNKVGKYKYKYMESLTGLGNYTGYFDNFIKQSNIKSHFNRIISHHTKHIEEDLLYHFRNNLLVSTNFRYFNIIPKKQRFLLMIPLYDDKLDNYALYSYNKLTNLFDPPKNKKSIIDYSNTNNNIYINGLYRFATGYSVLDRVFNDNDKRKSNARLGLELFRSKEKLNSHLNSGIPYLSKFTMNSRNISQINTSLKSIKSIYKNVVKLGNF